MSDQTTVKALISDLRRGAYDAHQSAESDFEELFDEAADALEASLVDSKTLEIDANKAGCVPPAPLSTDSSQPRGGSNERGTDLPGAEIAEAKLAIPDDVRKALENAISPLLYWQHTDLCFLSDDACSCNAPYARIADWLASHPKEKTP